MTTKLFIHLPLEVLVNIVIRLKLNDIRNLMLTCKTLNNLIMTESIFLRLIFRNKFMLQSRSSEQNTYSWYNRCRISQHWCKGIFKNRIIIQHVSNYMPWLQLVNSDTLYLSVGSELQCYTINQKGLGPCKYLWSKDVLTVERNDIRTNDISRFVIKGDVIVCGNSGSLLMTSELTRDSRHLVRDIQWHDENCIICVSHSGKLQLIDVRSHNVVYETTDPFLSSLYCVKTDSNRAVVVGSSEYSRCVLFDLRSIHHVQMYFTQKKSSCIYSLDFDSTRLIAAADRGVAALNFNVNSSSTQIRDYSHVFEVVCE